ncbi:MAG: T9SS type A sorting domain-containing protein [Bacteroidales bacterium]|nr:T9SS type A sorting domain-containing protein [Bacteroidales bacterium]
MKNTRILFIGFLMLMATQAFAQNGIIYTPFDTTFYYQGNSPFTGFSDDLTYCFDINKDSIPDILVTLSWDPHYDIKTRVLLSTNDFHNDSLGWLDTPDHSFVLSDYDDYQYTTWPPALEYHYPVTEQYHYGFIKKEIENNSYYGWYIMRGIWSSDGDPGITFSILESAYCTIPNYPLRFGQKRLDENVEENACNPVAIYPNPSSSVINLSFAENTGCQLVEIYAIDGRLLQSQGSDFERVDMSGLEPGIYIIKVRLADGREFTERIVKE